MSSHYRSMKRSAEATAVAAAAAALAPEAAAAAAAAAASFGTKSRQQPQQQLGARSRSLLAFAFLLLLSASALNSCFCDAAEAAGNVAADATTGGSQTAGKITEGEKEAAAAAEEENELSGGGSMMAVKRAPSRNYNFGLGKRGGVSGWNNNGNPSDLLFTKDKLIDFLLRQSVVAPVSGSSSSSNAGPTSYYFPGGSSSYADNYGLQAVYVPESLGIKRSKPQRFSFGLGKRASTAAAVSELEEVPQEDNTEVGAVEGEDDPNGRMDKRKAERYQFGLGKRSPFAWFTTGGSPKSSRSIDEFKRRYNFGLGK